MLVGKWYADEYMRQAKAQAQPTRAVASFVGSNACIRCHASEGAEWGASQHRAAMAEANEHNVLGDFNGARISHGGTTAEFFTRDSRYFVRTEGPDGKLADFEIKYTFGVQPLQQYLIELPRGRLQAFSVAWDSRPKSQHGQRWFRLLSNERIGSDDELHWTRPSQNWNFMCADCHSTGLRKNYDRDADRFQTHWAEISVGCEACHGPGSRHLEWAAASRAGKTAQRDSTKGLNTRLDERRDVTWIANAATGNSARSHPRTSEREIETCAQCHSRRGQIADGYEAGKPFLDYYRPALLTAPLYHADGQQRDEVYTWGSFLQSKMYAKGVTCSDCHDPHSGKPRAEGNAVCATCHQPAKYDTPNHHHHQSNTAGAACVSCHMPATTYMEIDPRHDHSLRVPRPDLSVTLGTPNACAGCHTTRDARWATERVAAWYGGGHTAPPEGPHERLATTMAAADAGAPDAQGRLQALASDTTQSLIARATAFASLTPSPGAAALAPLTSGLHDANPLIRFGALQFVEHLPIDTRLSLAEGLLSDSLKAIRIEAVRVLADAPEQLLSMERNPAFRRAAADFLETLRYNGDRAEARISLGTFLAQRGDVAGGERELRAAMSMGPTSIPAYVNLADVYRTLDRDTDGERILREGLAGAPKSGVLHYALGLVLTRLHRPDSALHEFARAAGLEPANARFAYVHAVALNSSGKVDAAIATLKSALTVHPDNRDMISALASFYAARGDAAQAKRYADRLRTVPGNR